jgi:hypothetical protein
MRRRGALAALVLLAAACSTPTAVPPEWRDSVSGIRGSWRGTWGGAPAALLITDQRTTASYSGLYVGTKQLFGPEQLGLTGILTSRINNEPTSVTARVWLGGEEGSALTLWIRAESPSGTLRLTLRQDGPDRLVGMGDSSFRWGPSGPIELLRQVR